MEAAAAYLKHGADINAIDLAFSFTPRGAAVRGGKLEMVKFVLGRGADPNVRGSRVGAAAGVGGCVESHGNE